MNHPIPSLETIFTELRLLREDLKANRSLLLTVDQAAVYLGLSAKTVRNSLGPRAVKPFPVKPVRVSGRVLFRRMDLDNYVNSL